MWKFLFLLASSQKISMKSTWLHDIHIRLGSTMVLPMATTSGNEPQTRSFPFTSCPFWGHRPPAWATATQKVLNLGQPLLLTCISSNMLKPCGPPSTWTNHPRWNRPLTRNNMKQRGFHVLLGKLPKLFTAWFSMATTCPRAKKTCLLHGDSQTRDISRNLTMMAMATGPKSPAVSAKLLMYLRWRSCRNGEAAMKYGHQIHKITRKRNTL